MWNIPHEVGRFLNLIIKTTNRKSGLEIGTSNGYSSIWLAEGLKANQGKLTTIEFDEQKIKLARDNFKKLNLAATIDLKEGNAADIIPKLDSKYDFLFIDAHKSRYLDWLKLAEKKLAKEAIVVADNRDKFEDRMENYLNYLRKSEKYITFRTQVRESQNDALEISYYLGP